MHREGLGLSVMHFSQGSLSVIGNDKQCQIETRPAMFINLYHQLLGMIQPTLKIATQTVTRTSVGDERNCWTFVLGDHCRWCSASTAITRSHKEYRSTPATEEAEVVPKEEDPER